jgi:signal transduction histidine kinase
MYTLEQSSSLEVVANMSISSIREEKNKTLLLFLVMFSILIVLYVLLLKNIDKKRRLLDSRKLFLRTIIHELKTPVAKGRLIAELICNQDQKDSLIQSYNQLDNIIDEFTNIEKITTDNYIVKEESFYIDEVIDKACEMLINSSNVNITQSYEQKIEADFSLLAIAFKNLLQNGIKYSLDKRVELIIDRDLITIKNRANKLEKPLKDYFVPYQSSLQNTNHGLGLGLYITKKILDMHSMKLEYRYKNGYNLFMVHLN